MRQPRQKKQAVARDSGSSTSALFFVTSSPVRRVAVSLAPSCSGGNTLTSSLSSPSVYTSQKVLIVGSPVGGEYRSAHSRVRHFA